MKTFLLSVLLAYVGCSKDDASPSSNRASDTAEADGGADDLDNDGGPGDEGDSGAGPGASDPAPSDAIGDTVEEAASLRSWDSWSEAVPLAVDAIDFEGDADVYTFQMPRGTVAFLSARTAGTADLQLRIVSASGAALATSQMMPYYGSESDPGIWVQAIGPAPMFLEVSAESTFEGTSPYQLHGIVVEGQDGEPNDTIAEASDRLADGSAGFRTSATGVSGHTEFLGWMGSPADVDSWAFNAPSTGLMAWSFWPVGSLLMEPTVVLNDPYGMEIGWTDDPYFNGAGAWYDDAGLIVPVTAGQRYTLSVSNARTAFDAGTLYVGVATMLDSPPFESEPNDDGFAADYVTLAESSVHPGYQSGTIAGSLDGVDAADIYRVPLSTSGFLSVHLQAGTIGSGLQPSVAVWRDPYGVDVIAEAGADGASDSVLNDVEVSGSEVFVSIQATLKRVEERGNHYIAGFELYPVPLSE